jgi:ATP-dependent Clp protease ATP-binding subunit ClpA
MMDAIQVWPQLIQVAGDIVAKAQDWPGADKLAERLQKTIPPELLGDEAAENSQMPAIDPQAVQEMQMQLQALAQENQMLKTDKTLEAEKVKVDAFEAETRRIDVIAKNQLAQTTLGVKAITDAMNSEDISKLEGTQQATPSGRTSQ